MKRRNPELLVVENPTRGGRVMARKSKKARKYRYHRKLYTAAALSKKIGKAKAKKLIKKRRGGGRRTYRKSKRTYATRNRKGQFRKRRKGGKRRKR